MLSTSLRTEKNIQAKAQLHNMTLEAFLARTSLTFQSLSHPPPASPILPIFHVPQPQPYQPTLSSLMPPWLCVYHIPCPACPVPSQVTSAPSRLTSTAGSSGKPPLTVPNKYRWFFFLWTSYSSIHHFLKLF